MRTAIYAGTFDPITLGHVDVARRASRIFDRLIFAVFAGRGSKTPLFTQEERVELARAALAEVPNVVVDSYDGLTVDYARRVGAMAMVRGIRTISDFDYEFSLAHMNGALTPDIESVVFMTSPRHAFISSSLLKEVARNGGDVREMVPVAVWQALRERFEARS